MLARVIAPRSPGRREPVPASAPRALAPLDRGGLRQPDGVRHDVASPALRDDRLGGTLARAVAQRASQPLLQRAIIAIDGPGDNALGKRATRNCLANLKLKPARGASVGPQLVGNIVPPAVGAAETLYILGHGGGNRRADDVAGLKPDQMGERLVGWYGTTAYTGKIKLVSCKSAMSDPGLFTSAKTYAESLRNWLNSHTTDAFKPASVDGVIGIAWVGEDTGKIQSIDLDTYRAQTQTQKDAFGDPDPHVRLTKINTSLGVVGGPGSGATRMTGKHTQGGGKVRYTVVPDEGVTRFFSKIGLEVSSWF